MCVCVCVCVCVAVAEALYKVLADIPRTPTIYPYVTQYAASYQHTVWDAADFYNMTYKVRTHKHTFAHIQTGLLGTSALLARLHASLSFLAYMQASAGSLTCMHRACSTAYKHLRTRARMHAPVPVRACACVMTSCLTVSLRGYIRVRVCVCVCVCVRVVCAVPSQPPGPPAPVSCSAQPYHDPPHMQYRPAQAYSHRPILPTVLCCGYANMAGRHTRVHATYANNHFVLCESCV